jgi:VanZ family protein
MRAWLQLAAFLAFLSLWTWKLLEPHPVPDEVTAGLGAGVKFGLAKSLHFCSYAFLTVLGGTISRRWRWWVVGLLMLHGIGTEIGQTFVPNRTGTVTDVLIDWAGIGCGVVVAWWRRSRTSRHE